VPRTCHRVALEGGGIALVTTSSNVNPNDPCTFCGRKPHQKLCDFPLRSQAKPTTDKPRRIQRCSKRLCERCATALGDKLDLCPDHAELVEEHALGGRLEPLLTQEDARARDVACDLIESVSGPATKGAPKAARAFEPRDLADWREFVGERAAIFEYEGGWPRKIAERKAMVLAGERPTR
jgi:hypothetical protein